MGVAQQAFSGRGYTHILKVGRAIADLAVSESFRLEHLSEAIQHRSTERHLCR